VELSHLSYILTVKRKVKFKNTLHTPEMRSSLISLSRLEDKEAHFESDRGKLLIKSPEGKNIMAGVHFSRLYVVNVHRPNTTAFVTYSKYKAVSFDIWH